MDSATRWVGGFANRASQYLVWVGALAALTAAAQSIPKAASLTPEWIQRGTTVTVTLTGENLSSVTNLVFSGDPGLAATLVAPERPTVDLESSGGGISAGAVADDKTLRAKVTVSPEASLKTREVRLVSPAGVSAPVRLHVGDLREISGNGANTSLAQAQKIDLPAAIEGRIRAAGETNYFRFPAKRGQNLIFDIWAFRAGSPLDSSLAILDAAGKELARNEDFHGFDSFIEFPVPADGEYVIQLRDFQFRGGADYKYRLVAGEVPYVDSIFPLGGSRGRAVEVELKGRNLDGLTRLPLHIDPESPLGHQDIRAHFSRGFSNPFRFAVGDVPEVLETEPNNATNEANAVSPPVVINGRIGDAKDVDTFKFTVDKDRRLICEVEASSLGSPLDSLLTLTDAKGTVLAQNDDANGPDARVETDFKKGAEYFLSVRDLLNRGGENYAYRISIHPPRPDFSVRFLPDSPRLSRGGHVPIRCELLTEAGFAGTVRVVAESLPRGALAEPLLLSSGAPSGLLVLSAAEDARLGTGPIRLVADGVLAGKSVTRPATPLSDNRPVQQAFLTVLDRAPFTIDPVTLSLMAEQQQTLTVEAEVHRWNGFAGEIKLSAEGYTLGREPITRSFELQPLTLKDRESHASLKLKARLDSETGTRDVVLKGEARVNGRDVVEYSHPVPVTVQALPFTLTSNLKRLSVAVLPPGVKSAAGEAVFTVKADRRGYTGPIVLTLDGLPETVAASVENIATNANEASIKLTTKEKAPVGKDVSFTVVGAATVNDRNYRERTESIKLSVTPPPEGAEEKTAAK